MKERVICNKYSGRLVISVAVAVVANRYLFWCNITLVQYNMLVIE